MISVIKTKNGTKYLARVRVRGQRPSKIFETRKDAEKWVNFIRFRRDQNINHISVPVTIQQMFEAYCEFAEEKGRSYSTLRTHRFNFKNHIVKFYGTADMTKVNLEEHQALFNFLRKNKVSAATRNRIRALIKVIYSVAVKGQLFGGAFKSNPFDAIEPAHEPKDEIDFLTQEDTQQLLEANKNDECYPLILTILRTGLRIGEALGIHEEQVDRRTGMLIVNRQFDKSQNKVVKRTKGKRSRVIYLIDEVLSVLPTSSSGPIFRKKDGSKISSDYFLKFILPKACARANVKKINPHGLRHTFSAHYLMSGGNIWDLSKILGHHSVRVTEKYYAHFSHEHVRNRMRIIEKTGNVIRASFWPDRSIKQVNKNEENGIAFVRGSSLN